MPEGFDKYMALDERTVVLGADQEFSSYSPQMVCFTEVTGVYYLVRVSLAS